MMESQVTSIEQSKRLLELRVPAEKASMVWCQNVLSFADGIDYEAAKKAGAELVPAFTVADLMEILPDEIDADCGLCYLQIKKLYADRDYTEWGVYYKNHEGDTPFESFTSYGIIEALFDMLEKLKCYGF